MATAATRAKAGKSDWLSKDEAARVLGVQPRQVQQRAAQGYIEKRLLPRRPFERQSRVEYSRRDVEALKAGTPNMHAIAVDEEPAGGEAPAAVVKNAPAAVGTSKDLALFRTAIPAKGLSVGSVLEMVKGLAQLSTAYAPAPPKAWMTLDEAADYSGLPAAWIAKLVRVREVLAVGRGDARRIQRASLDAYGAGGEKLRRSGR